MLEKEAFNFSLIIVYTYSYYTHIARYYVRGVQQRSLLCFVASKLALLGHSTHKSPIQSQSALNEC
jgi:uncharacterized membrane protein